jgi:endonuclease YncB( thermonuclease family)
MLKHGGGWAPRCLIPALIFIWLGVGDGFAESLEDKVERVVDGDTVILERLGRARLIGVDAPESVKPDHPPELFGREASEFARSQLTGRSVRVEFDGERTDVHGRTLVYLYLADGAFFNRELVRQGYAYAYTVFPFHHQRDFLEQEEAARANGRGMWGFKDAALLGRPLRGNTQSRVYHSANCRHYNCRNCTALLRNRVEAEDRGFRPHWECIGGR